MVCLCDDCDQDLWVLVFQCLKWWERLYLFTTCKRWHTYLMDAAAWQCTLYPHVENSYLHVSDLLQLQKMNPLVVNSVLTLGVVVVFEEKVWQEIVSLLSQCKNLRSLHFDRLGFESVNLSSLGPAMAALAHLTDLTLDDDILDSIIDYWPVICPRLQVLRIEACFPRVESLLLHTHQLRQLYFEIDSNEYLRWPHIINALANLSLLRNLTLRILGPIWKTGHCQLDLHRLTSLTSLEISCMVLDIPNASQLNLCADVSQLVHLESLQMDCCLDAADVEILCVKCCRLRTVLLHTTDMIGTLEHLGKLANLQHLVIWWHDPSPSGIVEAEMMACVKASFLKLKTLKLHETYLPKFTSLPLLEHFELYVPLPEESHQVDQSTVPTLQPASYCCPAQPVAMDPLVLQQLRRFIYDGELTKEDAQLLLESPHLTHLVLVSCSFLPFCILLLVLFSLAKC